jgi:hypothetical protein
VIVTREGLASDTAVEEDENFGSVGLPAADFVMLAFVLNDVLLLVNENEEVLKNLLMNILLSLLVG